MPNKDWMPTTRAGKNAMFTNFVAKIANYQITLGLTEEQLNALRTVCNSYIEIYDKTEQIRASNRDLTAWQDEVFEGRPRGDAAPTPPTFATITLPDGAFIGTLDEFRELIAYIKNNPNYTENIGLDLMIVRDSDDDDDFRGKNPRLRISVKNDISVEISFKKGEANAVEIQYRSAGTEIWRLGDKTTISPVNISPEFTREEQTEKFEFRGIYLVKNERVGNWSPIYSITVG